MQMAHCFAKDGKYIDFITYIHDCIASRVRGVIHLQSAREIMFNYNYVYSSMNLLVIWTHVQNDNHYV